MANTKACRLASYVPRNSCLLSSCAILSQSDSVARTLSDCGVRPKSDVQVGSGVPHQDFRTVPCGDPVSRSELREPRQQCGVRPRRFLVSAVSYRCRITPRCGRGELTAVTGHRDVEAPVAQLAARRQTNRKLTRCAVWNRRRKMSESRRVRLLLECGKLHWNRAVGENAVGSVRFA